jgi:hypothetical protein
MLDGFVTTAMPGAKFLASYLPARTFHLTRKGLRLGSNDYNGDEWVGKSHQSGEAGMISHSRRWVFRACEERDLQANELRHGIVHQQRWLSISRR